MSDSPLKQNRIVSLAQLAPHPRNYKQHPKEQIDNLVLSLQRFGQGRSIVVQDGPEKLLIVAGHGIVEAATALQWQEIRADILPADWSPEQITGYLIADNLHAQHASDDDTLLAQLLQEQQDAGFDLASLGSDDETLRQMLAELGDSYLGGASEDSEEDVLPDEVETRAKLGDVWQLGKHRLLCGDSTNRVDVERLTQGKKADAVITDPPYGISIVKNGTAGNFPGTNAPRLKAIPIAGDNKPFDPEHLLSLAPKIILWGGNHYATKLPSQSKWLIWDKKDGAFQGSDLGDCELAWTNLGGAARLLHHTWQGMYRKGVGERAAREHPTQKPVDLMIWCCEQADIQEGEVVLDCYLGSGTTLIACERTNRVCYGCEIEPRYCDVILARYEAETGQTAVLLDRVSEVAHA